MQHYQFTQSNFSPYRSATRLGCDLHKTKSTTLLQSLSKVNSLQQMQQSQQYQLPSSPSYKEKDQLLSPFNSNKNSHNHLLMSTSTKYRNNNNLDSLLNFLQTSNSKYRGLSPQLNYQSTNSLQGGNYNHNNQQVMSDQKYSQNKGDNQITQIMSNIRGRNNKDQLTQGPQQQIKSGSDFLNKLSNLESKSKCYQHAYLNEFFCLLCHKEICSHCLLLATSQHHGHQHLQIKDYLRKLNLKNKENLAFCQEMNQKFNKKGKNAKNVQEQQKQMVDQKVKDLEEAIDHRFDQAIDKLRILQQEMKKRYKDMILSNIEQQDKFQIKLVKEAKKTKEVAKLVQVYIDKGVIGELVEQAEIIEVTFGNLRKQVDKYENMKKKCQSKRETYRQESEKAALGIIETVSQKIEEANKTLDIPRFKQITIGDDINDENLQESQEKIIKIEQCERRLSSQSKTSANLNKKNNLTLAELSLNKYHSNQSLSVNNQQQQLLSKQSTLADTLFNHNHNNPNPFPKYQTTKSRQMSIATSSHLVYNDQ